jgi:glycosyltransferase involved in cell wall biosynthesis
MNNLVTVCITTYNRKKLLPLTLRSVLNQKYRNIEIIIVDDCSTDGTKELVENKLLKLDDRIRYIRHKQNKGLAYGRNTAINNASGKYFTFCDDDDEWNSEFIKEFVTVADCYNDNWCFAYEREYKDSLKNIIYQGYTPPVASQFYFLKTLKDIDGYNENIKSGVDHDLWLKLAVYNVNIVGIPKVLALANKNALHDRMTTNEKKRINEISLSLIIWKDLIEENFSIEFYNFFKKNYMYYLDKNFLLNSIKTRNLKNVFIFLFKIDKILLIRDIFKNRGVSKFKKKSFFAFTKEVNASG